MKKILYWAPCLSKVGTYRSTINSALSVSKYLSSRFSVKIINACGEWNEEKDKFNKNNIDLIDLGYSYFKYLPKNGYLNSRISYLIIILFSALPLIKLIKKEKPDFIIIHLITILPLFLNYIFNFNSKIILRISGFPKLNPFRKFFWKFFLKKVYRITCPSKDLLCQLLDLNLFENKKLSFLPDPILNIYKFKNNNEDNYLFNNIQKKNYFIAAGRLTKQKNFLYLINEFHKFTKKNENFNLLIFGEGEKYDELKNEIKNNNLMDRIYLMGYSKNIYNYMKNAKGFILSSLWEDPGFVLIEAAMCNLFIISSDCKNGPIEFLNGGKNGLLFSNNQENALRKSLEKFLMIDENTIKEKKILAKKNCKKYTLFYHQKILRNLLED